MPESFHVGIEFPGHGETGRHVYPSPWAVGPWLLPMFWVAVLVLAVLFWGWS